MSDSRDSVARESDHASAVAAPFALVVDGRPTAFVGDERLVPTVVSRSPVLGWKVPSQLGDSGALGFEVEVYDPSGSAVWKSGRVWSGATDVTVGRDLSSYSLYTWRVRVSDQATRWSPWATSELETGPITFADWSAQWLDVAHLSRIDTPFSLVRPVERARLYLTGQGVVRAWANGSVINPDRMDPTRTDFARALFRCYDLTDLLAIGENSLAFVVGLGDWARTARAPRLLAELVVWHKGGSVTRIVPGPHSTVTPSTVTIDEPFYLERHDARSRAPQLPPPQAPVAVNAVRVPASAATAPTNVTSDPTPPLREVQTFGLKEIGRSPGSRLFDVGTNIAGRSKLVLHANVSAGTLVRVLHGEHVGGDGHIDTTNLTMPYDHGRERQVVEYVAGGVAGESHEPWFAYFGFRYIEVRGLADDAIATVTAYSMHTDLAASGTLSTDSPTIDRLLATASRTLLNNVHGVPEDCPTREQAAWTGDTASVAEYELAAFDSAAFLDKWMADFETSQQPDGQLPAVSPDLHTTRMPSDPVWGSALHRVLLGHLLHYGDFRLVRRALPTLRRWADFQLSCTGGDGVISRSPISYGHDWLALEQTPPPIHHTGAVIDCLLALADLEEATGDAHAAAQRRESAAELRSAARHAFFDPLTGTFGNGSQGSYAVAVEAGILTGREADAAGERLVALIRQRGNRVSSGFATTRTVVRALTMLGKSHVVHDILLQPESPGVGAMLRSGPGTFWECWWIDPTNTGTGSLNHVGLGGPFAAWAWEGLAGLRPTAPGYSGFRLSPQFVDGVTQLALRTETVRGPVSFSYSRVGEHARLEISVPPGSECTLEIGGHEEAVLASGRHTREVEVRGIGSPTPPAQGLAGRPSRTLAADDVRGSRNLLADALVVPGRADPLIETLEVLACMPIPHEQPENSVLKVVSTRGADGDAPTIMITPRVPLPLAGTSFVYAFVDQCMEGPNRSARPLLRLQLSNGDTMTSSSTAWPAGWNRVAVDTSGIAEDATVVAIEVGLEYGEEDAENALAVYPSQSDLRSAFHLGEVGFSTAKRTW
ncbi:family 78 glycoside hydrolase catalytic domain [Microbacterium sp. STN6]|uniref:family 78 glycoside hydrolase catalytic domain n=1 Tax=Microbacterium sp. STN6 TaxID=2995588 RepID=UPI002260F994|nr:family 78 glycoside hydrolase catalytic domain [Microbacterium sp. STN6]MCX7522526.1 family 78 glycoside hydrolase catalytic domain [Microbacterium sp. STN6]